MEKLNSKYKQLLLKASEISKDLNSISTWLTDFKPIVYSVILENGYSPFYKIKDISVTLSFNDFYTWTPRNSNKRN